MRSLKVEILITFHIVLHVYTVRKTSCYTMIYDNNHRITSSSTSSHPNCRCDRYDNMLYTCNVHAHQMFLPGTASRIKFRFSLSIGNVAIARLSNVNVSNVVVDVEVDDVGCCGLFNADGDGAVDVVNCDIIVDER